MKSFRAAGVGLRDAAVVGDARIVALKYPFEHEADRERQY